MLLLLALAGCSVTEREPVTTSGAAERTVTFLSVNDIYRIEGTDNGTEGGYARLRALRAELEKEAPDLLMLHAGDALFPSLMSRMYTGEQVIDMLNRMDGDAEAFDERLIFTPGNHEFDKDDLEDAAFLNGRINDSQFIWLDTNLTWATGDDGNPLIAAPHLMATRIVESNGVKVGFYGLITDLAPAAYITSFGNLEEDARKAIRDLRKQGAELVVGVTHLTMTNDKKVLEALGEDAPDIVFGGHEHNQIHAEVGGTKIIKADAEARTAVVARVTLRDGAAPEVQWEYAELGPSAPKDDAVNKRVAYWEERLDKEYCADAGEEPGCFANVVGKTQVELVGEELMIRLYETNFGNWIVDQALDAAPEAHIAIGNSGSLRINQNVPPGDVTRLHIEETFQYPSDLEVLVINGAILQEVVNNAVTDWTGNGRWLQIAGFAFRHDPATETADQLTLLSDGEPRRIQPDDEIIAVVPSYVAGGGDGYSMLEDAKRLNIKPPTLRELVLQGLQIAGDKGISPQVEGRICNTQEDGPCLTVQ